MISERNCDRLDALRDQQKERALNPRSFAAYDNDGHTEPSAESVAEIRASMDAALARFVERHNRNHGAHQ